MPDFLLSDHEYRYKPEGGVFTAWATCTVKPIQLPNVAIAIDNVEVRVKAQGSRPAGEVLTNKQAYTFIAPPVPNANPAVTLSIDDNSITTAEQAILTATPSDSDGTIQKVEFYRGATLIGTVTSAPFIQAVNGLGVGSYSFTAKTFDDDNASTVSNPVSLTVTTVPVSNAAPVASAGSDNSITLPTNIVTLTGSGTDADGTVASYLWTKVSGTGGTITNPAAASTTVTGLTAGAYVFRLTVTDNQGATHTDDVSITVFAQPEPAPAPVTSPLVDDEANTFKVTINPSFVNVSDYGFATNYGAALGELPGGSYIDGNQLVVPVGNALYAAGEIGVYILPGANRPASAITYNPSSFTDYIAYIDQPIITNAASTTDASISRSGSNLVVSGGNGTPNYRATYAYKSVIEKWHREGSYIVGAKSATSFGVGFGTKANVVTGAAFSFVVALDTSTAADGGKVKFYGSTTNVEFSATPMFIGSNVLTVSDNDVINYVIERFKNKFTATYTNVTTGQTITETYIFSITHPVTYIVPNGGLFAIFALGGTSTITTDKVYSTELQNPDVMFIGDSITAGSYAGHIDNRWAEEVILDNQAVRVIYALPGHGVRDVTQTLVPLKSIAPDKAVVAIGTNNLTGGGIETLQADYQDLITKLEAAGIECFPATIYAREAATATSVMNFNTWLINTYSATHQIVDMFSVTKQADNSLNDMLDAGDKLHPNRAGHLVIANKVTRVVAPQNIPKIKDVIAITGGAQLDVKNSQTLPYGNTDPFTWAARFMRKNLNNHTIMSKFDQPGGTAPYRGWWFFVYQNQVNLTCYLPEANSAVTFNVKTGNIVANTEYVAVATYNGNANQSGTKMHLYTVTGNTVALVGRFTGAAGNNYTGPTINSANKLTIGDVTLGGYAMAGSIIEPNTWTKAMADTEVDELVNLMVNGDVKTHSLYATNKQCLFSRIENVAGVNEFVNDADPTRNAEAVGFTLTI